MKRIRKLYAATTLLIVLSVSALGGEISTGVASPPPPPPSAASSVIETGEMSSGGNENSLLQDDIITKIGLTFLQFLAAF